MNLATPLYQISGIGTNFARRLKLLNLTTVEDLIYHFPFRYDDFSKTGLGLEVQIGEKVTLRGEIWSIKNIFTKTRKVLTQAILNDGNTAIELTWFNQSWLTNQIKTGDRLQVSGKVSKYKNKISIVAPVWEKITEAGLVTTNSGETLHTGRLVPIYPETAGLSSRWIRSKIDQILPEVLEQLEEVLPESIRREMLGIKEAINLIHFPKDFEDARRGRDRLAFDELFFVQLATQKTRLDWKKKEIVEGLKVSEYRVLLEKFIKSLPFKLTRAQEKVIKEILKDLNGQQPMNRLVQGEVGSGKTVVAAVIAYIVHLNNLKTLYMAPTEILAFQHYSTLTKLLGPFGVKVGLYTGSKKFTKSVRLTRPTRSTRGPASSVSQVRPRSPIGEPAVDARDPSSESPLVANPDLIVGTHALLSDKLNLPDVGLVIIDEQQRFGVEQRGVLRSKAKVPHFLTMTATPIPRTVALTLYGDLDISVIDELPKGRKLVRTHVVPAKKRSDAYLFIAKKVKEGDQVYIITPLIEESETLLSVKSAKLEFEKLQSEVFPKLKLGLLHGKLKPQEKQEVLSKFKDQKLDILVSTSVVEVGVDVPNATIMVIEGAERFGLSQLHQLRGRVGRGEKESYCLLFTTTGDKAVVSRLKNLENTFDGLKLSELDLKIRGGGEIFGTKQSGRFELKIASFSDLELIVKTKEAAQRILSEDPTLDKYPKLRVKLAEFGSGVMPD